MDGVMKLEEIGFYTLSDKRALNSSFESDLMRCELILTTECNLKCPYCRPLHPKCQGPILPEYAIGLIEEWAKEGCGAIRFSGGEPTLYKGLKLLVKRAYDEGIGAIAISTNGTASLEEYLELVALGVNDFSISLDACCATTGAKMYGGDGDVWEKVVSNIRDISTMVYTTIGVVVTGENAEEVPGIVKLAQDMGVDDVRLIPSSGKNGVLPKIKMIPKTEMDILEYRLKRMRDGEPFRGLRPGDSPKCYLVLDDIAQAKGSHFPCIVYMREGGRPIGPDIGIKGVRMARNAWHNLHDSFRDPICRENCLDVCVDFNNKAGGRK